MDLPPLSELNRQIKEIITNLNEFVELEINIGEARERIAWCNDIKTQYTAYALEISQERQQLKKLYDNLFDDTPELERTFCEMYEELNRKWPTLCPTQWTIPPVYTANPIDMPKDPLRSGRSARRLVAVCNRGFYNVVMKYSYFPKMTRSSAMDKLQELAGVLAEREPSRPDLDHELLELRATELKAEEDLEVLARELQIDNSMLNFSPGYQLFCHRAKNRFLSLREGACFHRDTLRSIPHVASNFTPTNEDDDSVIDDCYCDDNATNAGNRTLDQLPPVHSVKEQRSAFRPCEEKLFTDTWRSRPLEIPLTLSFEVPGTDDVFQGGTPTTPAKWNTRETAIMSTFKTANSSSGNTAVIQKFTNYCYPTWRAQHLDRSLHNKS